MRLRAKAMCVALRIGAEFPAHRRLRINEIGMPCCDLVECADIDDTAVVHEINLIAELNRAEAMRDDDNCFLSG